jgi:hypothetical protein
MYKRFNELSFVIGLFFLLVSLILILNGWLSSTAGNSLTYYSGAAFFVFGVVMMMLKSKGE